MYKKMYTFTNLLSVFVPTILTNVINVLLQTHNFRTLFISFRTSIGQKFRTLAETYLA